MYVVTPPLPDYSSPMRYGDSMDMDMDVDMSSPMARKAAPRVVQVEIQSPTPFENNDMLVDSPVPTEEKMKTSKPVAVAE